MSKTLKRVLSMAIALVMVLSMVPTGVFHHHAHAAAGDVYTYELGFQNNGGAAYTPSGALTTYTDKAATYYAEPYKDGNTRYVAKDQKATLFAFRTTNTANCQIAQTYLTARGGKYGRLAIRLEGIPAKDANYM